MIRWRNVSEQGRQAIADSFVRASKEEQNRMLKEVQEHGGYHDKLFAASLACQSMGGEMHIEANRIHFSYQDPETGKLMKEEGRSAHNGSAARASTAAISADLMKQNKENAARAEKKERGFLERLFEGNGYDD